MSLAMLAVMADEYKNVWVLLDDRAGNRSQALGVANRLGCPYRSIELRYSWAAALPNIALGHSLMGLDAASKECLTSPWPKLVIAAGRRTAPVARWIKGENEAATYLVQIMDPRSGRNSFDLICLPTHDQPVMASNIMTIDAAPHGITEDVLAETRQEWSSVLSELHGPRIAVLIGGSTLRRTFTDEMAHLLIVAVSEVADRVGGRLMVTTSRRTDKVIETIAATLSNQHRLYRWDSKDKNPYMGYLAWADVIVVTGESVSMCSEACATGKPVYIYAPRQLISEKHARLHEALFTGGHARLFEGEINLDWQPKPLDVAGSIVAEIERRGFLAEY